MFRNKNSTWVFYAMSLLSPLLLYMATVFVATVFLRAFHAVNADLYGIPLGALLVLRPAHKMILADEKKGIVIPRDSRKRRIWPAAFAAGACFSLIVGIAMRSLGFEQHFSNIVQERLFSVSLIGQILFWGIMIPVAEELIHRGLVYPRLRSRLGMWPSAAVEALIFAVGHGNVIQGVYAFPAGIVLCLLREYGGLESAIAFHAGANLLSVICNCLI